MTVPVIGFNPTGRRQGNRPRGAIGGGFGGGSIPSTKSSNVQVSGLLLNLLDRYQDAQDRADKVRKYNSAKTWFANDLFMRKIMSFDEAARIFDANPQAAVEKFQVDPALLQQQGEETFNILQGLGLGKTPNQATSQPQTPTSGQTQTPTSIPPQTSTLPSGSFSYADPSTPLNDEGGVEIILEKSMPPQAELPTQTQTLPSTPTSTQQPQPKTLSNILQDFMRRGTPPTGPHAQPVSPEDLARLDEYYERDDEEVIQELIREDEERNNGRPVSPEKEEEIRNFVEGAVARQEDYIEKKDRAFFEQQAQIKKLRQARSAAALAQEDPRTNPLAALMQQETGVSGDGGLESEEDILKGLGATMQADLRSLFPQIPKGIPITRSLVNRLIPIATAQKLDRDIKVFRSEVKGKLDITADFKDDRPIEPTDVKNMIGPHGQILTDPNMTYREARALGYVAVPESIRKKVGKITSATELLKQFRILIPKVFTNNGDDIIASGIRFKDGIVRRTQAALKTNPDIILYQALSESLVTLFRAPVGESGAPSNFDIERLKKAIPSPISTFAEPFVMNRKTALKQMKVMEEIFEADIKASTGGEINPTPSLQLQKAEKDFKSSVGGIPDN